MYSFSLAMDLNERAAQMSKRKGGVSERILKAIANDKIWVDIVREPEQTRAVDFEDVGRAYAPNTVFEGDSMRSMPPNTHIVVLFPNHQQQKKKVLDSASYRTLTDFNEEINKRLHRNPNETQMYVCWADFVYIVKGIRGNVYVFWFPVLSIYTNGDPEIQKTPGDTGFLVSTDGHFGQGLIYPLFVPKHNQDIYMINPGMFRFLHPMGMPLFPCDTPAEKVVPSTVVSLSDYDVKTRRERAQLPDHERIDFRHHVEMYRKVAPPTDSERSTDNERSYVATTTDAEEAAEEDDHRHGNGSDNDVDDEVLAFLGGGRGTSVKEHGRRQSTMTTPEDLAQMDVRHRRAAVEPERAKEDEDDDSSDYQPVTGTARLAHQHRVPRGLVPRNEHRATQKRVAYRPARKPSTSAAVSRARSLSLSSVGGVGESDTTTSAESSPLPPERASLTIRPDDVPKLPLGRGQSAE